MEVNEQLALIRAYAELVDRLLRVKRFLQAVDASPNSTIKAISATILSAVERIENKVLQSAAPIVSLQGAPAQPGTVALLGALHRKLSKWFLAFHELLIYLPRPKVEPEVDILLQRSFGKAFTDAAPSVMLGSLYNAFEYDFLDVVRQRIPEIKDLQIGDTRKTVLQLALCDHGTPTAWSLLAHEFGHAIDAAQDYSSRVVASFIADAASPFYKMLHSWTGELLADAIALRVLGPTAAYELVGIQYAFAWHHRFDTSETHPATPSRVRIAKAGLIRAFGDGSPLNEVEAASDGLLRLQFEREYGAAAKEAISQEQSLLDRFLTRASTMIDAELAASPLPTLSPTDVSVASDNAAALRRGEPISSTALTDRGKAFEQLKAVKGALETGTMTPQQAHLKVVELLRERPASPAMVLAAGSQFLFNQKVEWFVDALRQAPPGFGGFSERLETVNTLLKKSLEVSAVHEIVGS